MLQQYIAFPPKRISNAVFAMIAGALLAGCSRSDTDTKETSPAKDTHASASPAGETVGGDGSEIRLDQLTAGDLEGAGLSGELACSFSTGDTQPVLFAKGIVRRLERTCPRCPSRSPVIWSASARPADLTGWSRALPSRARARRSRSRSQVLRTKAGNPRHGLRRSSMNGLAGRWECGP